MYEPAPLPTYLDRLLEMRGACSSCESDVESSDRCDDLGEGVCEWFWSIVPHVVTLQQRKGTWVGLSAVIIASRVSGLQAFVTSPPR